MQGVTNYKVETKTDRIKKIVILIEVTLRFRINFLLFTIKKIEEYN